MNLYPKCILVCLILFLGVYKVHANWDTAKINRTLIKSRTLQRSNQNVSLKLANDALKASQSIGYQKGIADANVRIGSIVYANGALDSSLKIIKKALKIYLNTNDYKGAAGAYLVLSYVYLDGGIKDSAFSVLYTSLKYGQKTQDSLLMAQIYIGLGNLELDYGNSANALTNYNLAEAISKRISDDDGLISAWDGLGRYFLVKKDYKKALEYFIKVDISSTKANDYYTIAQNLTNIALCHEMLLEYEVAKRYYFQALYKVEALRMNSLVALEYYNLGNIYLLLNRPDSSIYYLNLGIKTARASNDLMRVSRCYQVISEAYGKSGDYKSAFKFHQQYSALIDTIINSEKVRQISEMQTRYETEKKEQQILLLDAQNKTKSAQRNIFILGTFLSLLLAIAIFFGLLKTRKEKKVSENLLLNILPAEVADELKIKGTAEAQYYEEVTVLFTDFKNFTQITEQMTANELVDLLQHCFKAFDNITTKYRIEKIKTIGDSYMCAGGLPVRTTNNAVDVVNAGLEIQAFMKAYSEQRMKEGKEPIPMRLGIHTGPVVAGIVGVKKFAYDIWGDTVNTASRMESSGEPGTVNISQTTYNLVKDKFVCINRGKLEAKNKGLINMYFVEGKLAGSA